MAEWGSGGPRRCLNALCPGVFDAADLNRGLLAIDEGVGFSIDQHIKTQWWWLRRVGVGQGEPRSVDGVTAG